MSGARQGRRRRILQEEVLSASRAMPAYSPTEAGDDEDAKGRRYAFLDGSLGDALARRHFPARALAPLGALAVSTVAIAGLAAAHECRLVAGAQFGAPIVPLLDATSPTSLVTWLTSASMVCVALMAAMVFAVRRRRVDDYRGRHRLWRGAVAAAALLSIDAVTSLHSVAAEALSTAVGIRLLAGGGEWWLGVGGLVFGWVGLRVLLDMKESKLAFTLLLAAVAAGGLAVVGPLAGIGGASAAVVAKFAQLACYVLVGVSLVAYMRFLRNDVAAGIAIKPQKSRTPALKLAKETVVAEPKLSASAADDGESKDQYSAHQSRRKEKRAKAAQQEASGDAQWTDGSDGYSDDYNDDPASQRLSKSERKRLRKQKTSRRAA